MRLLTALIGFMPINAYFPAKTSGRLPTQMEDVWKADHSYTESLDGHH
jgi:hypothetical protein